MFTSCVHELPDVGFYCSPHMLSVSSILWRYSDLLFFNLSLSHSIIFRMLKTETFLKRCFSFHFSWAKGELGGTDWILAILLYCAWLQEELHSNNLSMEFVVSWKSWKVLKKMASHHPENALIHFPACCKKVELHELYGPFQFYNTVMVSKQKCWWSWECLLAKSPAKFPCLQNITLFPNLLPLSHVGTAINTYLILI